MLSGNLARQVDKDIAQAEHLASVSAAPRSIVAQLQNAVRRLGTSTPALAQALRNLAATQG